MRLGLGNSMQMKWMESRDLHITRPQSYCFSSQVCTFKWPPYVQSYIKGKIFKACFFQESRTTGQKGKICLSLFSLYSPPIPSSSTPPPDPPPCLLPVNEMSYIWISVSLLTCNQFKACSWTLADVFLKRTATKWYNFFASNPSGLMSGSRILL